mgnify:CR=1 FL=1
MAGIGFALRDLMAKDSLWAILESQIHGVVAVAGPWFFTIVTMALPSLMFDRETAGDATAGFVTVLLYAFSTSLALTGPIAITLTRLVSDKMFRHETQTIASSFVGAVLVAFLVVSPVAIVGLFTVELPIATRMQAVVALGLVTVNWIAAPMLSTIHQFRLLTSSYALGTGVFWLILRSRTEVEVHDLLMGFNVGMGLTNAILCGLVLHNFGHVGGHTFHLLGGLRKYWDLALGGLLYGAGIWVDKWLMWTAPEHVESLGGLSTYPTYDTVVFVAYVTTVPALALFIIKAETQLHEVCARFYQAIQRHADRRTIELARVEVRRTFYLAGRDVALFQAILTLLAVAVPTLLLDLVGMPHAGVFMFRFCVIGAAFHLGALLITVVLFYFDSRRTVLIINAVFLGSNLLLTWVTLQLGLRWYGVGYFMAGIVTFCTAWVLLDRAMSDLLILAFVRQNPAITESAPRAVIETMYFDAKTSPGPLDGVETADQLESIDTRDAARG